MSNQQGPRIKRRQFLANLLFAGGALTLSSLQGAMADPVQEGWELPPDLKERLESGEPSRLDPKPQETPSTPPTPPPTSPERPPIGGAVAPPKTCPPDKSPPILGKIAIPKAPPKR